MRKKSQPHSNKVTVYDSVGSGRVGLSAWRSMWAEVSEFHELIARLMIRDVVGQVRQSFLGYAWIALPPIMTALIFTLLRQAQIINVPMKDGDMPYALFALVGSTIWGLFSQVTSQATGSIARAGPLVSKIYFPREVLLLSAQGSALINLAIRVCIIALTFLILGYAPHIEVLLAPLYLLPVILFGLGLGLILAPINTMMRDVNRVVTFGFQFGMFLAPTVYPTPAISDIGSRWEWVLYWIHNLNPVSHFMQAIQMLINTGTVHWDAGLTVATMICGLTLLMGWRFFHVCEPLLAERL